ncbi:hypothetical protein JH06_2950 [Blastocystis sp. subtype 4]|uniref:hypothetical protein n=1 Tax=Blastocystis sp. subtype 4 TaxID=944170 RepID=UPI0007117417|nr:hypothetical protein JH06_2950 [Blastocystis sp. subtype 4]KNB43225.1 hypothetical protein JH06_2950 [Blastocystis sp. subtype 4]|eukprot:XP_014526668.1 hypothetical protein JH06_2950 [Blastocystis sp. subtype 4]
MRANPVIQRSFKKPASAVTVVKKKPDIAEDQFKRKQIPDWARGEQLKDAIRRQYEAEINYNLQASDIFQFPDGVDLESVNH